MRKTSFKNLTKNDIKTIHDAYYDKKNGSWEKRAAMLGKKFGVSERTIRKWCSENLNFKEKYTPEPEQYVKAQQKKFNKSKKRFIITWAQNGTPVHEEFFNNLEAYAKYLNAGIHVIAGRYKNPTSVFEDREHDVWDDRVMPYLDANRHNIHKHVAILSDVKIQPTAENPLSGLQGLTGGKTCVIGHPRVHMQSLPVFNSKHKLLLTTGSCTKSNFTDSKSGKKGEFHLVYGFVIVEIKDGETFFIRQVTATSSGSFNDLYFNVNNGKVNRIKNVSAIVLGDIHLEHLDNQAMNATKKMLDTLKPKHTILHDLFDGNSINIHEEENFINKYKKEVEGKNSLKQEVDNMIKWLKSMSKYNLVVTRGNHDDFIDRWIIKNPNLKKNNPKNLLEYIEYAKILMTGEAPKGIIPYIIDKNVKEVKALSSEESYKVFDWELGQHGNFGPNGSKGSVESFRKLNYKMVVGHMHSPARTDNVLVVGVLGKLKMGYNNNGASSWMHSNVIIHEDKKAQHIHIIDGEFTTLK